MQTSHFHSLLQQYVFPQKKACGLLFFFILGQTVLQLAAPQILQHFIDSVTSENESEALWLAFAFFTIALLEYGSNVSARGTTELLRWRTTNRLREDLLTHALHLDASFHTEHTSGEMIEVIDTDVDVLSNFFSLFTLTLLANFLLLVGVLAMFFQVHWMIGLALTIFSGGAIFFARILQQVRLPVFQEARDASARYYSFVEERMGGILDIRANGAVSFVINEFLQYFRIFQAKEFKTNLLFVTLIHVTRLLFSMGTILVLAFGIYFHLQGSFSLGTVYLLFSYSALLVHPLNLFSREMVSFQRIGASISRIQSMLDQSSQLPLAKPPVSFPAPPQSLDLSVHSVNFNYPQKKEKPVLQKISFLLKEGQCLGILGKTGAGKSSLVRLLTRQYDPTQGRIDIGGIDLRDLDLYEFREKVAYVSQNVQLLSATLRDNLRFYSPNITDAQLMHALEALGLENWLHSLPQGLDTILLQKGANLSAGQAQMVALTRIFLKNPSLLILDEASSRLDPKTEQQIQQAIERLRQGRTVIIVAHRLSWMKNVDQILILENGRVLEYGSRSELENTPHSHYQKLCHSDTSLH